IVRGDRFRLRQVVDNLLTNVRVHTPSDTPIIVYVGMDDDMASLAIADKGPGIGKTEQKHIFDRFWRGGPARLRSGSGTGLGLAIVASLIEAHGGTIRVTSEPDSGTSFLIHLPLVKPA
ncbi:MAG TPA: HAMP domain-containing sensor histidine kinase, partial [Thermomicrobiales bacterium]|nr:HAMP domain-containing sensor histidine kinase [Thermomicrobiales bacterium]